MKPSPVQAEQARIVAIGAALNLTPRESAIAALIHARLRDKEIAEKLNGNAHTIMSHMRRIRDKIGPDRVGIALAWERASVAKIGYAENGYVREPKKSAKMKPLYEKC